MDELELALFKVSKEVLRDNTLNAKQKLYLLIYRSYILQYPDQPTEDDMLAYTGMSRATYYRIKKSLKLRGLI